MYVISQVSLVNKRVIFSWYLDIKSKIIFDKVGPNMRQI